MGERSSAATSRTWRYFYPHLQAEFPEQFGKVRAETFHRALNKVQPSLSRVDADEMTYCLHIILRFELEREIFSGEVALADLPEALEREDARATSASMCPTTPTACSRTSTGRTCGFGYFPTYALGNVVSVQLWERGRGGPRPSSTSRSSAASSTPLREWLGEHVHRYGRVFTPKELLLRETGSPMDAWTGTSRISSEARRSSSSARPLRS